MADPVAPVSDPTPPSTPPAPPADPSTPPTVLTPAGDPPAGDPPKGVWPDTWRQELSAGDEKAAKRLERFQSPADIFKSFRALEQRMSSGELKANVPFPEKGTDEEKTAWRTSNGVPPKADEYLAKLPDGLVIGEADKETMSAFAEAMHGVNAPPALVHKAIEQYYAAQEKQIAVRAQQDSAWKQETEDALRGEWGNDYRQNVTRLGSYLDSMGELGQRLKGARLADGRPLFADADSARYFMSLVNELEPAATLVPGSGNQVQAIADEISGLKKMMGDQNSEYWKGPNATKNQDRYRKLVEGQAKLQKKAA